MELLGREATDRRIRRRPSNRHRLQRWRFRAGLAQRTTPTRMRIVAPIAADYTRRLAEAEDELGVVGHLVRRPRRVERQLDLDLLHALHGGRRVVDVLLDHRSGGGTPRGPN